MGCTKVAQHLAFPLGKMVLCSNRAQTVLKQNFAVLKTVLKIKNQENPLCSKRLFLIFYWGGCKAK